ncbi:hypothetical protein K437DRAFT_292999 [Tilletiaria anomala UBC 951]|uniref:Nitrate reductase [NADPH] n=1 Tax=Tilletiaria anomala (strain ATCC 24038 / CBS 436.72 / UBC 951) TaxID=1037660 RepID=A0A066WPK5_TILAU|nr:uncharacterized protein K437DRAFT_292999 [Tilletiaria anomala UBC 951]KDN52555.1 hypothetical protein K437DRAFT_292999 [Tilletiaria anomala UBC 951]
MSPSPELAIATFLDSSSEDSAGVSTPITFMTSSAEPSIWQVGPSSGKEGSSSSSTSEVISRGTDDTDYEDEYPTEYHERLPPVPAGDERMIRLRGKHPLNVEAPLSELWKSGFITPTALFFDRNHGYVPRVEPEEASNWRLRIHGLVHNEVSFSIQELKDRFETITLPITLPKRPAAAYSWDRDTPGRSRHVVFECIDELPNGKYGTSQRLVHCLDRRKGILIAWGRNGKAFTPDHGFPLRLVVPGQIGGRMVKWLNRVEVSDKECQHHLHFQDNKVLPAEVTTDQARTEDHWWYNPKYIIYNVNVNAAIACPAHNETIEADSKGFYDLQGYAYTGGGKRISRAEISLDDGDSWQLAELDFPEDLYRLNPIRHHPYFGTLDLSTSEMSFTWSASVITIRATDEGLAQMPRDLAWNATGTMNGCWHRVAVLRNPDNNKIVFEHPTVAGNTNGGWMQRLKDNGQNIRYPIFGETAMSGPQEGPAGPDVEKRTVRITAAQVADHANERSPWFVIKGHVFDGTSFLAEHPGGVESIALVAGEDATDDFMAIHSMDAKKKMRPLHLGILDSDGLAAPSISEENDDVTQSFLNPKKWKKSKLVSKETISGDSRVFRFALDHPDQEPAKSAGGKEEEIVQHAYTPFSNNELRGYIDILIKVYFPSTALPQGGKMSVAIDNLKAGEDFVELKGPLGSFTYLGIFDNGPESDVNVWIVDANRTESNILARTHIDEVVKQSNGRIKLWHILSGECAPEWPMGRGRVNEQILQQHMPPPPAKLQTSDELEGTIALVCGPPPMERIVAVGLAALGWDLERIVVFF